MVSFFRTVTEQGLMLVLTLQILKKLRLSATYRGAYTLDKKEMVAQSGI
jgi:hypothetical protein